MFLPEANAKRVRNERPELLREQLRPMIECRFYLVLGLLDIPRSPTRTHEQLIKITHTNFDKESQTSTHLTSQVAQRSPTIRWIQFACWRYLNLHYHICKDSL